MMPHQKYFTLPASMDFRHTTSSAGISHTAELHRPWITKTNKNSTNDTLEGTASNRFKMTSPYSHRTHPYSHMTHPYSHMTHPYSHMTHPYSHMTHPYSHRTHPYSHMTHPYSHMTHQQNCYLDRKLLPGQELMSMQQKRIKMSSTMHFPNHLPSNSSYCRSERPTTSQVLIPKDQMITTHVPTSSAMNFPHRSPTNSSYCRSEKSKTTQVLIPKDLKPIDMRIPARLSTRSEHVLQPVNINNNENGIAANNVGNNDNNAQIDDDDNIEPLEAELRFAQIICNFNRQMHQQKENNWHLDEDGVICID